MKVFLSGGLFGALLLAVTPALADKVVVLPFTSPNNVPPPELVEARKWTQEAVTKRGHTFATDNEMVSANAAVKDGVADTSQEYIAAGKAAGAAWTVVGHVERHDHPAAKLPSGAEEEGYTTYRVEIEACQVDSGRVESLSREVMPDEGASDIAEMLALLVRPEGIANAEIPWERSGPRRPKPKPKPAPPPTPPPPKEPPPLPAERMIYGAKHPLALGLSVGVTNALARPDGARGPSWAMPIGGTVGYAFPDSAPGLEVKANLTSQVIGPRALELAAGARYALAPLRGVRFFLGPEVLVGAHVALGADKTTRFLGRGALFAAYGVTENVQLEIAGDLAGAFGGTGTLILGGGTFRGVIRF